ncbi:MAG: aspartate kinase [Candidatus Firestonebacteria bacterium RIFOXYC2_FULL_39_67]|nr:MAG: aspartate kinase [Candidatus Firestonebacteria bacterium RIFOXYD2_FULL_39_29]OGF55829.1 MAG: aspartate kinase [Candidatus Firestonebacteria bacterium RIFOXYC2_FULL_39_67]
MGIIVQKFGGSSVATPANMKDVARRIVKCKDEGNEVVVVVSAPGDETDNLIDLAKQITDTPDEREMDVLLATGEQKSIALMAIAIKSLGCDAISFTGPQVGIVTDDVHGKARIVKIGGEKIVKALKLDKVVIVAGFQGMDVDEDITTLGRGGSDLTAVAIATALGAEVCELYKDVDGILTTNPKIVPEARLIKNISYEEMLEMASAGAQVVNARSIEYAQRYNMPVRVRPTFNEGMGTMITKEAKEMEKLYVSGVTYSKDEAKVTVYGIPDKPGNAGAIFRALADENINVDMIVQDVSEEGVTNLSFTIGKEELKKSLAAVEKVKARIGIKNIMIDEGIAKISVIGVGMRSHAGVAAMMFEALSESGVNIEMISTSEIKISVVIDKAKTEDAVRKLHLKFNLDKI